MAPKALTELAKSEDMEDHELLSSVRGIAFFGVPHDGMEISHLIPMVGEGPNRPLIDAISRVNSQALANQKREFTSALKSHPLKMVCFYETRTSPTARKVCSSPLSFQSLGMFCSRSSRKKTGSGP